MDKYQTSVATFDKLAQQYQDRYMEFEHYFDTYDAICDLVTTSNAKILDIGCGPANISSYLLKKRPDFQVHGTDLSPAMVELAKTNVKGGCFEVLDSREICKIDQKFDAVICGFNAPYLDEEDVAQLITDISSLSKPNGVLYFGTMEGSAFDNGYQTSLTGDQVYIHYHSYPFCLAQLQANGLELIEVKRKMMPLQANQLQAIAMFLYARKSNL
ncbi:class I SAM-dependent methyltransferase [Parashewanella curva]|uniref:Class I SAM-dependent methyltransferase n=1 Tax=Parashewanella curva TaxID=2338552 RepID=A0A3L8PTW1_9GAMM|nr:class I SAM-dependent methyltransferase [Parashewanella curva]RLV58855.1 class I SAM-dependent methyltransferase [Parashewanella curva]